ncbi:VOC family protein [Shewanella sp. LC6]|uniref:VOC family protein n=1 Tax=unclassified Shewanella TaxID=196818 RepID=UPI00112757E1|nr:MULTISPECIES: VOC family protein [unclassified Shewanella]QQK59470.1 VOC family protein [Shewanella sp. LC6]TPE49048.1 VOC family protein [Shewanella sp. LC2]
MAKVIGLGGIFFKSTDPVALATWYKTHLEIPIENWGGAAFYHSDKSIPSYHVWTPFDDNTTYFAPTNKSFMVNFIVDDLEQALLQVTQGGGEQIGDIEDSEFGRFGWFIDPDGNKVELWQPSAIPPIN